MIPSSKRSRHTCIFRLALLQYSRMSSLLRHQRPRASRFSIFGTGPACQSDIFVGCTVTLTTVFCRRSRFARIEAFRRRPQWCIPHCFRSLRSSKNHPCLRQPLFVEEAGYLLICLVWLGRALLWQRSVAGSALDFLAWSSLRLDRRGFDLFGGLRRSC